MNKERYELCKRFIEEGRWRINLDAQELLEAMVAIHNAKQVSLKQSLVMHGVVEKEDTEFSMNDIAEKVVILQTV